MKRVGTALTAFHNVKKYTLIIIIIIILISNIFTGEKWTNKYYG